MHFLIAKHQCLSASIALAFSFVFSLYLWPDSTSMDRNHPTQIKRRFISIGVVSALSPLLLIYWTNKSSGMQLWEYPTFLDWVGVPVSIDLAKHLLGALAPVFLTFVLFIGPHYASFVHSWARKQFKTAVTQQLVVWVKEGIEDTQRSAHSLMLVRNLLVGPLAEEWVFRGCMLPLLISGKFLPYQAALISPGLFGLCHAHHLLNRLLHENSSLGQACAGVFFQLFYTTLFGYFASMMFLRTGNLLGCTLAHMLCNYYGFPDVGLINSSTHRKYIIALYFLGMFLFGFLVGPLTNPEFYESIFFTQAAIE